MSYANATRICSTPSYRSIHLRDGAKDASPVTDPDQIAHTRSLLSPRHHPCPSSERERATTALTDVGIFPGTLEHKNALDRIEADPRETERLASDVWSMRFGQKTKHSTRREQAAAERALAPKAGQDGSAAEAGATAHRRHGHERTAQRNQAPEDRPRGEIATARAERRPAKSRTAGEAAPARPPARGGRSPSPRQQTQAPPAPLRRPRMTELSR